MQEKSRGKGTVKVGVVTSDRMTRTVVVKVERLVKHPAYHRFVKRTSTFMAHDERGECHVGDTVEILECRPLSRRKRWRVRRVIARAVRLVHPVRQERRRADQRRERAGRDPRVRAGGARAAREEVHEDHFPRSGGPLMRAAHHVRKNDTVFVLAGKDRGKKARVLRIVNKRGAAIVEGVALVKRHTKPSPQKNVKGGIVEKEAPV